MGVIKLVLQFDVKFENQAVLLGDIELEQLS